MNGKNKARIAVLMMKAMNNELNLTSFKFRFGMINACTPVWVQLILIGLALLALYGATKLP